MLVPKSDIVTPAQAAVQGGRPNGYPGIRVHGNDEATHAVRCEVGSRCSLYFGRSTSNRIGTGVPSHIAFLLWSS